VDGEARYDAVAEWYDRELADSELGRSARAVVLRLLGRGPGRLLDAGCGGGSHAVAFAGAGWTVTGVDVSEEQLRLARARGVSVVRADLARLPFADASFDAAVSMFTHTDVADFDVVARELARVLRPGGRLVYLGVHPCFVGPHSRFAGAEGIPELHPGYRDRRHRYEAPGITPGGLRSRVGAAHLPLDRFLAAFLGAKLVLRHFEEPESSGRPYPYLVALRAVRPLAPPTPQ
jgi:SAM-dependent methyltransferase